jgi:radical SAM superfamily enzyme YgiQ (UPF0313 family)
LNLADKPELLKAMVAANFMYVFIGIETPDAEALKESHKLQNLRGDNMEQVRIIQEAGLWVIAGFIVGFDSDDDSIFERQREFIETTNIAWAMAGFLMALPTTPLHERMKREGRLHEDSEAVSNFNPPNFDTVLPMPVLLRGLSTLLSRLYEPAPFFDRARRSLEVWQPSASQFHPPLPISYRLRVVASSIWHQGLRSPYKREYWKFFFHLLGRYGRHPTKIWLGSIVMLSAQHFLLYSREVAAELEQACRAFEKEPPPAIKPRLDAAPKPAARPVEAILHYRGNKPA